MTSTTTDGNLSLSEQRTLWRRQSASLPSLHGGKRVWLRLVAELVGQVDAGNATTLDDRPHLPIALFSNNESHRGAPATKDALTWGQYGRFLKAVGLARMEASGITLTEDGRNYFVTNAPEVLGIALSSNFRLLAESLKFISESPCTVDDLDSYLRASFSTDWKSLGGVRSRIDWLDALGAIEAVSARRWSITTAGTFLLSVCKVVTPEALALTSDASDPIEAAPEQIQKLLNDLKEGSRTHESRSTYNIWVPSPASQPNKVENLRIIVNAVVDPLSRTELLDFIAVSFNLRRSSVDSMLPFLRASGLILEVGYGVYQASPAARAWLSSGSDINFIRLLHAHMQFVGEMIHATIDGATRTEVYAKAKRYGLNVDKSRWIAAFLQDTGLMIPPKYGSLRATQKGIDLLPELPLAPAEKFAVSDSAQTSYFADFSDTAPVTLVESLTNLSRTPLAKDQNAGKAFEAAISEAFSRMGFESRTVSGSGDTDILVSWRDAGGTERTAIVEAKSRASGSISHTDVSDVALETHKTRNGADYVAIVAPAFAGETIKSMATKRSWVLLEASLLGAIAEELISLGIGPELSGELFDPDGGLEAIKIAINAKRRELSVLTFIVGQLVEESAQTGDPISPRDISRDGRNSEIQPSVDEVLSALALLQEASPGAIRMSDRNANPKFSSFVIGNPRSAASSLRAIADAIEAPLLGTT